MFFRYKKKWILGVGLIGVVLLLSLVFNVFGEVKDVQAVGGSYAIDFTAALPSEYIPPIPYPTVIPAVEAGRFDGNSVIPGAEFDTSFESLDPSQMALGQIIPYFFEIEVSGSTEPEGGCITIVGSWSSVTTSNNDFGFDDDIKVYSAFIDTSDIVHTDTGDDATVVNYTEEMDGTDIIGTFYICGLDEGDSVVLEVWMVLDDTLPEGGITGNVQAALEDAYTTNDLLTGDAISTGQQTVPLNKVGQFESVEVDLNIYKTDDNEPKALLNDGTTPFYSDPWTNTIVVNAEPVEGSPTDYTYVANEVLVVDTLDPWVQFQNAVTISGSTTRECTWADYDIDELGGTLTCDLGAVLEEETVTITYSVRAQSGVPIGSTCEGTFEEEPATSVAEECPPTWLSPQGYDVKNSVVLTTISDDITPDDNWDEEPKDIVYPTSVDIEAFEATGKFKSVLVEWTTVNESDLLGFNLYRATSEDAEKVKVNDEIIPADIFGGGASYYEYLDMGPRQGLRPNQTYFYWLEDVDFLGYTTWHGPVEATASPHKFK